MDRRYRLKQQGPDVAGEEDNDEVVLYRWPSGNRTSCSKLQDERMAPLLPPVGSDVFRRFTPESLEEIQRRHEDKEKEGKRKTKTEVQNKLIRCEVNTVPF